jgi:hypothetical protein
MRRYPATTIYLLLVVTMILILEILDLSGWRP